VTQQRAKYSFMKTFYANEVVLLQTAD